MPDNPRKSFASQVVTSSSAPIHFLVCRDRQGHIVHYFIKTTPEKLKLLLGSDNTSLDPSDYGMVIASGFGRSPDMATLRMLKEEYQYDYTTQQDA